MKRWISMILAFLMFASLLPATVLAVDGPALRYELTAEGDADIGSIITVTFSVIRTDSSKSYQLNAMQNEIEYDSDCFRLVSGSIQLLRNGSALARADERTDGTRIIAVNDMQATYSADETICTFQLKVIGDKGSVRSSRAKAFSNDADNPRKNIVKDASSEIVIGDDEDDKIHVTMRLIGAELAEKDVDLGKTKYLPDYVTWIPTTKYDLDEGSYVYDLWVMATEEAGIKSVGANKNYVSTVYAPDSLGGYALSEFTNGKRSGWMYTINGKHPGYGLKEQKLEDGDVVIWHYVNDYSYEVDDWFSEGQWQALGDGTYYNRWLLAPDRFGGKGGGVSEDDEEEEKKDENDDENDDENEDENTDTDQVKGETVTVVAEVEDGEAKATVEEDDVTDALENSEEEILTVVVTSDEDADTVELELTTEAVKAVSDADVDLHIETEHGTVKLDTDTVSDLAESGESVTVTVQANEDGTTRLDVAVGGKPAEVTMKVELPSIEDGEVLVIVQEDGTEEIVKKSLVEDGKVYAELPAGTTVRIIENSKDFEDVKESDWFSDAVDFASSHELFVGVSETEFAPKQPMTRAMLVTVLFRLEDEPDTAALIDFDDVNDDTWFTDAVEWAAAEGIVNGVGDGLFAPNDNVTREQIATMLYRYVKYLGYDVSDRKSLDTFYDGDQVSDWAKEAMQWAVKIGLFQGDDTGSLNPKNNATRAEVATLMQRLVAFLVK